LIVEVSWDNELKYKPFYIYNRLQMLPSFMLFVMFYSSVFFYFSTSSVFSFCYHTVFKPNCTQFN